MAGLNETARGAMLDANASVWPPDAVSLHTADPGDGSSPNAGEVAGGTPPYARKSLAWSAASAGVKVSSGDVVFDVPASTTVSHVGYWRGATFLGSRALSGSETFTAQGTYTLAAGGVAEALA